MMRRLQSVYGRNLLKGLEIAEQGAVACFVGAPSGKRVFQVHWERGCLLSGPPRDTSFCLRRSGASQLQTSTSCFPHTIAPATHSFTTL